MAPKPDVLELKLSDIEIEFINQKATQYGCSPQGYIEGLLLERMKGEKIIKPGESPELASLFNYLANNSHDDVARQIHYVLKFYLKGERIPKKAVNGLNAPSNSAYTRLKPGEQ